MRQEITDFLKNLRNHIVEAFEKVEKHSQFEKKVWKHTTGGGGEISLLRGEVFEKAAVNWSAVSGDKFPMQDAEGSFFATGISLITHMSNPHAPTAHFNIRYIETETKKWFGGGYDLTPMGFPYEEDTLHFHSIARHTLDQYSPELYALFSKNARDYFFIPHYGMERGVGGIFFDHFNTGNFAKDFSMWKHIGTSFLDALLPILNKRIETPFSDEDKEVQLKKRAHYVEFNLLYDRGTKFGFLSGGNPEAILCSMPPVVKW